MFGGISARGQVLVLADAAGTGQVLVFDLSDRRIATRFRFADESGSWTDVGGIALAEDSSLFVPDTYGCCIRRFSLFGKEVGRISLPPGATPRDRRGLLSHPRAVCLDERDRLWVTCGDRPWVHGLQVFEQDGRFRASLPAFGGREKTFGPALGLCRDGRRMWVADTGNDAVQCFRADGSFEAAFRLPEPLARPLAVAAWDEGRAVLVSEPEARVVLFDRHQRQHRALRLPAGMQLIAPSGLLAHDEGLLVLDRDSERVLRFSLDGEFGEVLFDVEEWGA